ncbi:MAG TPA: hypothetical protein VGD66_03740 [Allosphingosinicella sp.]
MTPLVLSAVTAFNLICTGTEATGTLVDHRTTHLTERPFTDVYRVDLLQRRWCRDACTETSLLEGLTATSISFEHVDEPSLKYFRSAWTKRETGEYMSMQQTGDTITNHMGECRRAAFGGFPPRKF